MGTVSVTLLDDTTDTRIAAVATTALAELFSYAHQWALQENRNDPCTLSFSSMLAAMIAGTDPVCGWLRSHLALRGVRAESMTKGRSFRAQELPDVLFTTISFRRALAKARELCSNEQHDGLAVRHFMAAYVVVPAYHLGDYLRLRIDRRAWCIELAKHLASKFPDEKDAWLKYAQEATPVPSLGFNTDAPEGRDLLNVDREVEAFARLIGSRNTATPLSVGVFGAWGSGKSFFMHQLHKRVASFARLGRNEGPKSKYHGWIAQIDFNAWHYSEGNLAASFVDHILRNLRVAPDETAETLKTRSEVIIRQLDSAKQDLAIRQNAVADAETRRAQAEQAVADLDVKIGGEIEAKKAEIATARTGLEDAQNKLAEELAALQTEIEAEVKKAPATAIASLLLKKLDNPEVLKAATSVRALIAEAQAASAKRKLIFYGLIVLAIGAVATALIQTNVYAQVIAAVTAMGGLAATAGTWLKKLDALAQSGKELEDEQRKIRQAIVDEVTAAHDNVVSGLRTVAAGRLVTVEKLGEQLKQLEQAPATARLALEALEKQRTVALEQHAKAAAVVESKNTELAKLTTGTLLEEFLDDRVSNDGYLKELTIFSRIRNDFEKLSDLMTQSNEDYVAEKEVNGKVVGPPAVSRIVLYIDDLDRCPADRVVEVLKLVHLLLAFPLFVCVAAVDPRWITRCLQQAPGLIDVGGEPDLNAEVGVPATASDYLEKIFQIPLWLRPVPPEQRAAITRTLLDPSESADEPRVDLPIIALRNVAVPSLLQAEGPEDASEAPGPDSLDPDIISSEELNYLDKLAGLLGGNPRSLKRFVNTYRLVKTALSDVELAVFLQPLRMAANMYSPYRICMAQLAVLCTQRTRALNLVRHADQATENTTLTEWLSQFENVDADLGSCLRIALREDLEGTDVNTFKLWLERTRRYSFYL
jgi:predicted transcriptional regulator